MQVNAPDIQPATKVDIGELLLTTVQRSETVVPELQAAVATYAQWLSQPVRYIEPTAKKLAQQYFGMDVKTDPKLPTNHIRLEHPDGRVDGFRIGGKG